jgi:preprotein translocase subunit SecE
VYFNEYKRPDTIWVNTWQVVKGFAAVLVLVALYVAFAWLEG